MLEGLAPKVKIPTCKIQATADGLSESDQKIFLEAIRSELWTAPALSGALKERGLLISDTTIRRHRNKACGCY